MSGRWVSWAEAAALTGLPVTTIESWTRTPGRLVRRPQAGMRPSLSRSSVLAAAVDHERRQNQRRKRRLRPRPAAAAPQGWVSPATAAERIGRTPDTVHRLAKQGLLTRTGARGAWWVDPVAIEGYLAERRRWVSTVGAAQIVGCGVRIIESAAGRGQILQRHGARGLPSLDRASVERFAELRRAELKARERRRAEAALRRPGPPDEDHEWLDAKATGAVLGISANRVGQLSRRDRIPHTHHSGRRWYRRDHIKALANARAMRRSVASLVVQKTVEGLQDQK